MMYKAKKERETSGSLRTTDEISEIMLSKAPGLKLVQEFTYPNGSVYRGQMKVDEECREGYGVQVWTDGAKYEGYWIDNKAQGRGTFWHAEGDLYDGEFKEDKANGYGIYTHVNGSRYEGDWKEDMQDG